MKSLPLALLVVAVWLSAAWHEPMEWAGLMPDHLHSHGGHGHAEAPAPDSTHHGHEETDADSHAPVVVRGHQELEVVGPVAVALGLMLAAVAFGTLAGFFPGASRRRRRARGSPPDWGEEERLPWQFARKCAQFAAAPPAQA